MKTMMMTIVLFFGVAINSAFAERLPVLTRLSGDNYYPIAKIGELAKGSSDKSQAFLEACLVKVETEYKKRGKGFRQPLTVNNFDWICSHLKMEEIHLRSGIDANSLWDTEEKRIDNFTETTNYDGPGWVYHDYENDVHFAFFKGNCLNLVWISEDLGGFDSPEVFELQVVDHVDVLERKQANVTIYDTNYIYKTVYLTYEEIHEQREVSTYYYGESYSPGYFQVQLWAPIWSPPQQQMGGCNYNDNSYYNNQITTYNIDNSNTVINPRPKPQPNPGGPVDPPIDPVDPNPGGPVDPPIDPVTPPGENGQDPDLKRGETGTTGNQSRYEPSGLKSASASSRGNSATNNPSRDQQTDTKSVSNRQGNPSNSSTRNSNTVSMDARNSSPVVSSNGKGRVNNPTQNRGNNNSTPQNRTSGNTYSSQRSSSLAQSGGRTNNGPTYKQGGTNSSSNHSKSVGQPSRSPSVSPSGRGSNPVARPAQRQAPSRSPVARSSPSRSPGGNRSMGRR